MVKTIPAVKARVHLGELMKKAFKKGDRFIVEKSGIPMVVIMNATEYQQIVEEREERFKVLAQIKRKVPTLPSEEVDQDIQETIQEVRTKRA